MITKFHGVDKHKTYSTISVKDQEGKEINFISRCKDLKTYIESLGKQDALVLESSTGAFYYADLAEARGVKCFIIDPYKFKIIKDSWKKTDKSDARNMSHALWISILFDEYKLPEVYKPELLIRELRKLYTQLNLLNKQLVSLKNNIQAILVDNGIVLSKKIINRMFNTLSGKEKLDELNISEASKFCIIQNIDLINILNQKKEELEKQIYKAGEPLKDQVKLLLTIKGISPLLALAFLADVADIKRFKKCKQMNAYLGVCPRVKSSGGKSKNGHINRESRKLSRTLFTQSIYHISYSSPVLRTFYSNLAKKKGFGKARIALIRKIFGIMRRMLLDTTEYKWINKQKTENKIKKYEKDLIKYKENKNRA